jgi:hypothetical protein
MLVTMPKRESLPTLSHIVPVLSLLALAACNEHTIKSVEQSGNSTPLQSLPLDVQRKVDVLLVIDNSSSMGEEQANLAKNFAPFIEQLEAVGADYRIAITTTDRGGPNCAAAPTGGRLLASSCVDRPADFAAAGKDVFEVACASSCALGDAALQRRPTAIAGSDELAVRPWIESANGVSNLPDGVDTLSAFQCLAPQGIAGCGWEAPLESIARAIDNMLDESQPEYGFLRDDALLAVLIVTDEVDCSYRAEQQDALFDSGAFFAEDMNFATSAVCWNAGTHCEGDPLACEPADYDAEGTPTSDASAAVLHPVSRYTALLQGIADNKLGGREVLVSLIAGVPDGYPSEPLVFAPSDDPDFQKNYGIGAGCTSEIDGVVQTAVPPVRLRALAEAFPNGGAGLYSVCSDDYTPAIIDIVDGLTVELPPACYGACVLDLDASSEALDYDCEITQSVGPDREVLPECIAGELPEGADACWIIKTGADMADACAVVGQNAEFELVRRKGVAVPEGANVVAACRVSTRPSIDCA